MENIDHIVELELSLHKPDVRKSRGTLGSLLCDNFMEIGSSGKTYDKTQVIDYLLEEEPHSIEALDFKLRNLSDELCQLIYSSCGTKKYIRSSIWKLEGTKWRMLFHQGTVINDS